MAKKHNLFVVEDAAQAFMSSLRDKFLGTIGDIGCFSLGVTKFMTSGQGGFLITGSDALIKNAKKYIFHSAQGEDVRHFNELGFNFRMSDLLSSIALFDLEQIESKKNKYIQNYLNYKEGLRGFKSVRLLECDILKGEVPIWIEVLSRQRESFCNHLKEHRIESVKSYPSLHRSEYLSSSNSKFPNSELFETDELILPCGPDVSESQILQVLEVISSFEKRL
ncbi:MAG: DegT/DnrJ/EryC1/StrS family aminotransferase [Bdellovibrionota bacterium]